MGTPTAGHAAPLGSKRKAPHEAPRPSAPAVVSVDERPSPQATRDFSAAPISEQPQVKAANPQRQEPSVGAGGLVVAHVPRAFNLHLDRVRVVPMKPGIAVISKEVADHPYARGQGVTYVDPQPEMLQAALQRLKSRTDHVPLDQASVEEALIAVFGEDLVLEALTKTGG